MNKEIIRPKGFENEKRDCVVRAFTLASNKPYSEVHQAFKNLGRKDRHGINTTNLVQKASKLLNVNAKQIKRHGTAKKLLEQYPNYNLFCVVNNHAFSIINGQVNDLKSLNRHIKGAWIINEVKK